MCRSGKLHSVLCCDRDQEVSWGLPTPCMLLFSCSCSLQQVLVLGWAGHWDGDKKGREVGTGRMVWNSRASHCWLSLCGSSPRMPFSIHPYRRSAGSCSMGHLSLWWAGAAALLSQPRLLSEAQLSYLYILFPASTLGSGS